MKCSEKIALSVTLIILSLLLTTLFFTSVDPQHQWIKVEYLGN